jgi:inosine/xanthosine triphosphate pyrophosphatase family protein
MGQIDLPGEYSLEYLDGDPYRREEARKIAEGLTDSYKAKAYFESLHSTKKKFKLGARADDGSYEVGHIDD